jgi:magnesium chelatase subunit D
MTEAWLVVVTDGLANVPLAASLAESAQFPVAGQGVTDALRAASRIAGLRAVRSVVITPERVPHRELPMRLASAMGAGIIRAKAPMGAGGSGTDVSDGT